MFNAVQVIAQGRPLRRRQKKPGREDKMNKQSQVRDAEPNLVPTITLQSWSPKSKIAGIREMLLGSGFPVLKSKSKSLESTHGSAVADVHNLLTRSSTWKRSISGYT